MAVISSRLTWSLKWLPAIGVFGGGLVGAGMILARSNELRHLLGALVAAAIGLVLAWLAHRPYASVADRVDDEVDHLRVRHGATSVAIPVSEIGRVTMKWLHPHGGAIGINPLLLVLELRDPWEAGSTVTFAPKLAWWSMEAPNLLREDLQRRANRLRSHIHP